MLVFQTDSAGLWFTTAQESALIKVVFYANRTKNQQLLWAAIRIWLLEV